MSHRNTPSKTTVTPTKRAKKPAKLEKAASGSTRGGIAHKGIQAGIVLVDLEIAGGILHQRARVFP